MEEYDEKFVSTVGKKIYHKRAKNGYVYTLTSTTKSGTEYWKCKAHNCVASLVQNGDSVKLGRKGWDGNSVHTTHGPDFNQARAEMSVGAAKKMALEDPFAKTSDIWDKAT